MNRYFLALFFLLACRATYAQTDWHLKKDEDGIKVFTADDPNSAFKSIKVECAAKGTLSQLAAFLLDIKHQPDWVYNSKSAKLIRKVKDNELVFYSEVSVPWPCTNRDYIAHFSITQPAPGKLIVDSHAEPDVLPVNKGIVRVRKSSAHWDVTAAGEDLKIVYVLKFDPAGAVPAWLTNLFVTKGPYQTFHKLREGMARAEYRNVHLDFAKN